MAATQNCRLICWKGETATQNCRLISVQSLNRLLELTWCQECFREVSAVVFPVHCRAFLLNKLYQYAGNSTLVAVVPSHGERITVTESIKRDFNTLVCCYVRVSIEENVYPFTKPGVINSSRTCQNWRLEKCKSTRWKKISFEEWMERDNLFPEDSIAA